MEVINISLQIERFLDMQMYKCNRATMQEVVLKQFLGSLLVSLHFLPYYLTPVDAKIEGKIVKGFKEQLQKVKSV